jgi:hypothetical protein
MIYQEYGKIALDRLIRKTVANKAFSTPEEKHQYILDYLQGLKVRTTHFLNSIGYLYYFICPVCFNRKRVLYTPVGREDYRCFSCYGVKVRKKPTLINLKYMRSIERMKLIQEILLNPRLGVIRRKVFERELSELEEMVPKSFKNLISKLSA